MNNSERPPFVLSTEDIDEVPGKYPGSDEIFSYGRALGMAAGLLRTRLHVERLPPGHRIDVPYALENEEEFFFVHQGRLDAWIDGEIHPMRAGDMAAFPSGTGISHTFINNSDEDVVLLVGGERRKADSRIYYPVENQRRADPSFTWSEAWTEAPRQALGPAENVARRQPALSSASIGLKAGIHACKNNTQRTRGF